MTTMQLVEQHIIRRTDERWAAIDQASFLSKNLYNAANYLVRQAYIFQKRYLPYEHLASVLKQQPDYCALPRKVSQQVLKQLDHDWRAFFAALKEWQQRPEKFLGRPGLPKYKPKSDGRNVLIYTAQAVSQRLFKSQGLIAPSQLGITVPTQQLTFDQVRIAPRKTHYEATRSPLHSGKKVARSWSPETHRNSSGSDGKGVVFYALSSSSQCATLEHLWIWPEWIGYGWGRRSLSRIDSRCTPDWGHNYGARGTFWRLERR